LFRFLLRLIERLVSFLFGSKPDAKPTKQTYSKLRKVMHVLLSRLFTMLQFLYNTFIFIQLSCIGYAESFRVKKVIMNVVNRGKRLRVIDRDEKAASG
jgi:hypothetical protein